MFINFNHRLHDCINNTLMTYIFMTVLTKLCTKHHYYELVKSPLVVPSTGDKNLARIVRSPPLLKITV